MSRYVPEIGDVVNYKEIHMIIVEIVVSTSLDSFTAYLINENFVRNSVPLFMKTEKLLSESTKVEYTLDTIPFTKLDALPFTITETSYTKIC